MATQAPTPTAQAVELEWQTWGAGAFEQAASTDKLVLLDVGIEGCTACRWMDELTYTDPAVRARLAEHFVIVAVDAEAVPHSICSLCTRSFLAMSKISTPLPSVLRPPTATNSVPPLMKHGA